MPTLAHDLVEAFEAAGVSLESGIPVDEQKALEAAKRGIRANASRRVRAPIRLDPDPDPIDMFLSYQVFGDRIYSIAKKAYPKMERKVAQRKVGRTLEFMSDLVGLPLRSPRAHNSRSCFGDPTPHLRGDGIKLLRCFLYSSSHSPNAAAA